MEIFQIDHQDGRLQRIFQASSRAHNLQYTWANDLPSQGFLLDFDGAGMLLFDPSAAMQRMGN